VAAVYEVADAAIMGPGGPVLEGLTFECPDRAVTVVLGAAASGKSVLLRALSGRPALGGWSYAGRWAYRGRDLLCRPSSITWVPQTPRRGRDVDWGALFRADCPTLLLDEPSVRGGAGTALARCLRRHVQRGAAVLVTHDLCFAQLVADEVLLLCAGRVAARAAARSFFEHPPNELAARFVAQGNCWPSRPPAALPNHFHWLLDGRLGAMGRPGLNRDLETDLEAIATAGIDLLVTLTGEPVPADRLRAVGMQGRHFPIRDMGVPSVASAATLCREIERTLGDGRRVAIHCHAGLGRTGTMVAALLIWMGRDAEAAAAHVRSVVRGAIQSEAQMEFLRNFAAAVGR
jgi:atypical dual specificity phosphatase